MNSLYQNKTIMLSIYVGFQLEILLSVLLYTRGDKYFYLKQFECFLMICGGGGSYGLFPDAKEFKWGNTDRTQQLRGKIAYC